MWLLMCALIAPPDPNATYQSLDMTAKERIYLVYNREVSARQKVDESVDATAAATNYNEGVVRLVVSELKRDGKFLEQKKLEARGLSPKPKKKNETNPARPRRSSRTSTRPTRPTNTQRKEYSGDGITMEEGQEKIKFNGKTYKWWEFRRLCTMAPGEKVAAAAEKQPILVDAQVTGLAKHWTVVDALQADGTPGPKLVILKAPSTKSLRGLRKNDSVRLWGWVADETQIKAAEDSYSEDDEPTTGTNEEEEEEEEKSTEKERPAGVVFFVMDLDEYRKDLPGLVLSCEVSNVSGSTDGSDEWEIEVTAKNEGPQKIIHLEVESNVVLEDIEKKKSDPEDSALVYFASLEAGQTAQAKVKLKNWTGANDEVTAIPRPVNGRFEK